MSLFRATAMNPERLQSMEAQISGTKGTSTLKKLKHRARASLSGLFDKPNGEEASGSAAQSPTSQSQSAEAPDRPHIPALSNSVRKRFTSLSGRFATGKLSLQSDARDSKISMLVEKQEQPERSSPIPIPAPAVNVPIPCTELGSISDWGLKQPDWEQPHGNRWDSAYGSTTSSAQHTSRPRLHTSLSGSLKDFKPDATPTPMPGTTFPLEVNPTMTPKSSVIGVPPALKEQERVLAAVTTKPRLSINTKLDGVNGDSVEAKLAKKSQQLAITSSRDYYGTNNSCSEDLFAPAPTPTHEHASPATPLPDGQAVMSAMSSPEEGPLRRLRVCNPDHGFGDDDGEIEEATVPSPASTESDSEYFRVPDPEDSACEWEEHIRAKYLPEQSPMAAPYISKKGDSTAATSIHDLGMWRACEPQPETTKKPTDPYLEKTTPLVEGEQPRYWWW